MGPLFEVLARIGPAAVLLTTPWVLLAFARGREQSLPVGTAAGTRESLGSCVLVVKALTVVAAGLLTMYSILSADPRGPDTELAALCSLLLGLLALYASAVLLLLLSGLDRRQPLRRSPPR